MHAVVFPGQGSQRKGMGAGLFDMFREQTAAADDILGYSIRELCVNDPHSLLDRTEFTQPAVFVVNALEYMKKMNDTGIKPAYLAGHSLGEYNALHAAGAVDFVTALAVVKKRGELMSRVTGGGMAAVMGLAAAGVISVIKNNGLALEVANYNSPMQTVVSGTAADIAAAEDFFSAAGARMYVPLRVSGPFHSSLMNKARDEFAAFLDTVSFGRFNIPVVANLTARPYDEMCIRRTLADQVNHPVMWTESVIYLMRQGVTDFDEPGEGRTVSRLVRAIKKETGIQSTGRDAGE